jgi:DNA-binding transcriptional ArsR family regulator
MKGNREIERMVKGFANHRRVEIMRLLASEPELSLSDIAEKTKINMKTASEHLRRLAIAGIVLKRNDASSVRHALSPRGVAILKFLRTLE